MIINDSFLRHKTILLAWAITLFTSSSFAQNVKVCGQTKLNKWGVAPGNYSGISHVRDNLYAIVDDKDVVDGFKFLELDIDRENGKVLSASLSEPEGMKERRANGESSHCRRFSV